MSDMIPLPADADGKTIHIDDEVYSTMNEISGKVDAIQLYVTREGVFEEVTYCNRQYKVQAALLRHYHKPTVEDVLREFGGKYIQVVEAPNPIIGFGNEIIGEEDPKEVIAEYAAKLQLKED